MDDLAASDWLKKFVYFNLIGRWFQVKLVSSQRNVLSYDNMAGVNYVNERNWALLDMEYIQTSKSHQCIRKLYILAKDGFTDLKLNLYPCKKFQDLEMRYKKSHWYCQANIHQLPYYPNEASSPCSTAAEKLRNFIINNNIDLILFKGGQIEENIAREIGIASFNIEHFNIDKVFSHDPYVEVNSYYIQLVEFIL